MKSKIICLLLAMVMVLTMLASCGGNGDGGDGDDPPPVSSEYDIYWNPTTIIYELTMESDGNKLPSGAERYYAGDGTWKTSSEKIDVAIRRRNDAAQKQTNTKVSYK